MQWTISAKTRPTMADGLLALCVLALAGALALSLYTGGSHTALTAVVRHRGVQTAQVPLNELDGVQQLPVAGDYHLTVCFDSQGAWVQSSDCPTQDCLHTGKITRSGESIVCLPEQVVVELVGQDNSGFDAVLG